MSITTTTKGTATKAELQYRLAILRFKQYPQVYRDDFEAAEDFARLQYKTKYAAIIACDVHGISTAK